MRARVLAVAAVLVLVAVAALGRHLFAPPRELPPHQVEIVVRGEYRTITSNGIPDHETGRFPNAHNPNTLRPQAHAFRVPARPEAAAQVTPLGLHPFGVAVNGIPFDPGAAEFWRRDRRSGWQYEPMSGAVNLGLDASNAHVQPTGAYHYHALPTALVARLDRGQPRMLLLGYAADGFPLYATLGHADPQDPRSELRAMRPSYRLRQGTRPDGPGGSHDGSFVQDYEYVPGLGDLDECNGRHGVTPEHPEGLYHYHLTTEFPFIPRCFRGTPDPSFFRHRPPRRP